MDRSVARMLLVATAVTTKAPLVVSSRTKLCFPRSLSTMASHATMVAPQILPQQLIASDSTLKALTGVAMLSYRSQQLSLIHSLLKMARGPLHMVSHPAFFTSVSSLTTYWKATATQINSILVRIGLAFRLTTTMLKLCFPLTHAFS